MEIADFSTPLYFEMMYVTLKGAACLQHRYENEIMWENRYFFKIVLRKHQKLFNPNSGASGPCLCEGFYCPTSSRSTRFSESS